MSTYRAHITISVAVEATSPQGASFLAHDFLRALEDAAIAGIAPDNFVEWDGSAIAEIVPHPYRP